jgi:hypothetical protein
LPEKMSVAAGPATVVQNRHAFPEAVARSFGERGEPK